MMRPSHSTHLRFLVVAIGCAAICALSSVTSRAAEPGQVQLASAESPIADGAFQVTIEIVDAATRQLQDRHLVLFRDGKSYDFALTEPHDGVTVIDPVAAKVTLLSRVHHVKSTIANQDLLTAAAKFRLYAINEGLKDRLGIDVRPEKTGVPENKYHVIFPGYHYIATATEPAMNLQPDRFAEFTDWAARVNLIRKLGTPPFARINLGRTIATDGLVPQTITLELKSGEQSRTFESSYTFKNGLSKESQKRLDDVASMMTLYREVPLEAFPR